MVVPVSTVRACGTNGTAHVFQWLFSVEQQCLPVLSARPVFLSFHGPVAALFERCPGCPHTCGRCHVRCGGGNPASAARSSVMLRTKMRFVLHQRRGLVAWTTTSVALLGYRTEVRARTCATRQPATVIHPESTMSCSWYTRFVTPATTCS